MSTEPNNPKHLLIIANSARMLAETAKNAGFMPLVIDLYADLDTQKLALEFKKIPSLAWQDLKPAVEYFLRRYGDFDVVYGSGFEYHPESLASLARYAICTCRRAELRTACPTVLGNSPVAFFRMHNKAFFFIHLSDLDIPYPEVLFTVPVDPESWLLKPLSGQGGVGIKRYRADEPIPPGVYWQRYQTGTVYSVLFLADGLSFQTVGFNTQWTADLGPDREFMFAGVVNHCDLSKAHKATVEAWIAKLVPKFRLKGLNSLDFIHDGNTCWLLEINPRLSASMQLYDADLLKQHIATSKGNKPSHAGVQKGYTGCQIVYARQNIRIPKNFVWPDECRDIPEPGATISTGQPICSIIASKKQAQAVLAQLSQLQHTLETGLYPHEPPRKR